MQLQRTKQLCEAEIFTKIFIRADILADVLLGLLFNLGTTGIEMGPSGIVDDANTVPT